MAAASAEAVKNASGRTVRGGSAGFRCSILVVVSVVVFTACSDGSELASPTTSPAHTAPSSMLESGSTVPGGGTILTDAPACVTGEPKVGIDLQYEDILRYYRIRNAERLVSLIGDGSVYDPSLEPETEGSYPTVTAWLSAAGRVHDVLSEKGYGYNEPFQLFIERRNPGLREVGIDHLSLTLSFWVNQDCQLRVESGEVISAPDPCLYAELYQSGAGPAGCDAPFEPRAGHVAVWTGDELLIYGGTSGTHDVPPLITGLGFDPESGSWRDLSPSPQDLAWWPTLPAVWADDEMMVVGRTFGDDSQTILVLSYAPAEDVWSVSPPLPADRMAVGGVAWTGTEFILVGGDLNYPDDTAWAYNPSEEEWRQLPDPEIEPVEGIEGVWTGSEAIFFGGYTGPTASPGVAYNPASGTWRHLPSTSGDWIEGHGLVWTGQHVLVYSGHTGPGHPDRVLLYNPETDAWSESSPIPIAASERLAGAWTGDRLIIWGGYATYREHDDSDAVFGEGASYDPVTDTWTALPPAPLADRCDHTGTWTGILFVVFGGMTTCGSPQILADGNAAAYDPTTNKWQPLSRP